MIKRTEPGGERPIWPQEPCPADWLKWSQAESVTLEVATALSLGFEPAMQQHVKNPPEGGELPRAAGRMVTVERGRPNRRLTVQWHAPWMTREGHSRLCRMREYHGTPELPAARSPSGQQRVRLQDLARFAALQGWPPQPRLAALLPGQEPKEGSGAIGGVDSTSGETRTAATDAPKAGKSRSKLSDAQWAQLHGLRRAGAKDTALAEQFGTSRRSIHERFGSRAADIEPVKQVAADWASPVKKG